MSLCVVCASPPSFRDIVTYMSSFPSVNVSSVELSTADAGALTNSTGFLGQPDKGVLPYVADGIERMNEYLLVDKVRPARERGVGWSHSCWISAIFLLVLLYVGVRVSVPVSTKVEL